MDIKITIDGSDYHFASLENLEKFEDMIDLEYNEAKEIIAEAREAVEMEKFKKEKQVPEDAALSAVQELADMLEGFNERLLDIEERISRPHRCNKHNRK